MIIKKAIYYLVCESDASPMSGNLTVLPDVADTEPTKQEMYVNKNTELNMMTSAWRPIPPVGPCPSIPANNLVRTSGRINKISNKIACCALNLTNLDMF